MGGSVVGSSIKRVIDAMNNILRYLESLPDSELSDLGADIQLIAEHVKANRHQEAMDGLRNLSDQKLETIKRLMSDK